MTTDAHACGNCGLAEGKLHELGCGMERCRECGGQFISCDCAIQHFYPNGLPREVYENGLTKKEEAEWLAHIETLGGRVPYIDWPILCARCGKLWPDFFHVSDDEWARYVEPAHRQDVLCAECYEFIKSVIGDLDEAAKHLDRLTDSFKENE
jgi:hypothetical protein